MEIDSLNSFGYPLIKRTEEIANKIRHPESQYIIEIMGRRRSIPVISVRIEFPVYRLANGRTRSAQLEYLTINPSIRRDLFTGDNDSYDAQRAQHEILKQLVRDEDLLSSFQRGELEQVDPILCTNTGVVVNGNRRLCAWRILYYGDKTKYKTFETIQIAVLPDMDEKGILDIEKKLQILKTMRAEYRWHTKALMAETDLMNGQKDTDVANSFDMSKKKLLELIEARRIAGVFLESIGHPNEWSRLDKSQYAFDSIVTGGKKIIDPSKKELFQKLAFDLIKNNIESLDGGPGDRLYNTIRDYAETIDALAEQHQAIIAPVVPTNTEPQDCSQEPSEENVDTSDDNDSEDTGDDAASLLSGGEELVPDDAGIASTAIDKGGSIKHEKIAHIIEAQKSLRNEKDRSVYLTKQLSKIVSDLDVAINNGLDDNTIVEGVSNQLDEIQKRINRIRTWLSSKG
ncbi:MAG: hypothetical protein K6F98_01205 [Bacteroidales bacterium]|nr:hypothetical protein [Bacteroidales bacterium]